MSTVNDLVVEPEMQKVEEIAQTHGWSLERVSPRCFRVTLIARTGDTYQLEIECDGFPARPPAFHWRNPTTGELDNFADSPDPYNYFHGKSGRICAPWNRLASMPGGPHTEWVQANWQEQPQTQGTLTLAAMILRIHFELCSSGYRGRRKC